jgi:branched-chain amino acid transport system substrate-binding protein
MKFTSSKTRIAVGAVSLVTCLAMIPAIAASASSNSPRAATGTPIDVMAQGFFSGAADPYPELPGSFQAAVDQINDNGGIAGHPINLTLCNDQDSPDVAQGCAEQAVSGGDVAVMTVLTNQSSAVLPTLEAANIPYIGDLVQATADATDPNSFPISSGSLDNGSGPGVIAVKSGCKKAAVIIGDYGVVTNELESGFEQGLKSKGGKDVDNIEVSTSVASYSPAVSVAIAKGAQCIIGALGEAGTTELLSAVKQAGHGLYTINFGSSYAPLKSLGKVAIGSYVVAPGRIPTDKTHGVQLAITAIKKYSPGTAITGNGLNAFADVLLLADGLRKVQGSYTAATVLAAMNNLTNASTDAIYPPYTTTKPGSKASEPREFNPYVIAYKITGANQTKALGTFTRLPGFGS